MLTPEQENARTLARLVGISEDEANEKLKWRLAVSSEGPSGQRLAELVTQIAGLTVQMVTDGGASDLEIAVNCVPRGLAPVTLSVSVDTLGAVIRWPSAEASARMTDTPSDLALKIAACYLAGVAVSHCLGPDHVAALPNPFVVDFQKLGISAEQTSRLIELEDTVLIGAGGVASGFLWAAQSLRFSGRLEIVDPKRVAKGNLNRNVHFTESDIGENKVEVLAERAAIRGLELIPVVGVFKDLINKRGRVKRVIVTVDSRPARRAIQNELPLEVLDASTTDVRAVVVHSHSQPNEGACLSCIYKHIPEEDERERSIAEGLGLTVEEVKRDYVDIALAKKLCCLHQGLTEQELIGTSLTTLYKTLCGAQALKTAAGTQALAPFAFVSNLAGALLALELTRFDADRASATRSTYLSLDPWRPPHGRARRQPGKLESCEFCGNPLSKRALAAVWPEHFGRTDDANDSNAA